MQVACMVGSVYSVYLKILPIEIILLSSHTTNHSNETEKRIQSYNLLVDNSNIDFNHASIFNSCKKFNKNQPKNLTILSRAN